ncbi:glycine cleavage H-protein-domain-containing protein [Mucidula mucida]|nr:glycine cleavage H-protein-domain-containing protein [Mucidula mucida]
MQSVLRRTAFARAGLLTRSSRPLASPYRSQFIRTLITKRYTSDHESVVFDDETGLGVVSITDYAQSSLGDVVFVELPTIGSQVEQGSQIGAVESVKAASDIYAPVSGIVKEVNESLSDQPSLINKSPEDKGWLCKIQLSDPKEMETLLTEKAYTASLEA